MSKLDPKTHHPDGCPRRHSKAEVEAAIENCAPLHVDDLRVHADELKHLLPEHIKRRIGLVK